MLSGKARTFGRHACLPQAGSR